MWNMQPLTDGLQHEGMKIHIETLGAILFQVIGIGLPFTKK